MPITNQARFVETVHDTVSCRVTHSTRIECHRFDPIAGRETLRFYPDGRWYYQNETDTLTGQTTSQSIGRFLQTLEEALTTEDECLYAPSYASASHWHVEIYFHHVLVKRESGPVLPAAITPLASVDHWLCASLGLPRHFFTTTKGEARA